MENVGHLPAAVTRDVLVFVLVLLRVGGLVATAPLFASSAVGWRLRAGLAVMLALLVTPLEAAKQTSLPEAAADLLVLGGAEAIVGLVFGLALAVLFSAMQVAGHLVSQSSGMHLADAFDPGTCANSPVVSQLLFYVALAVFLSIGGHRQVLAALLDSFAWLPAGSGQGASSAAAAVTSVLAQSFVLGVRAAAPAAAALVVATLVLGLAGRALPQVNMIVLGFGLNALVAFVTLSVSLGAIAWVFQDELRPVMETVVQVLGG
jgi:flagellar biosynthetic protein FliR